MNKEPIALYIFRFVMGFALFAFMCMLYWSSVLMEDHLGVMRAEISQVKSGLASIKSDNDTLRQDLSSLLEGQRQIKETYRQCAFGAQRAGELALPHTDALPPQTVIEKKDYPNLLQDDPFFAVTLPKLMGKDFKPGGIQHTATVGKPDSLHPFTNWSNVSGWHDLCNVSIAKNAFGKYETFTPDMAVRVEERINQKSGLPEFWLFLRQDLFWQPLQESFFSADLKLAPWFLEKHQVTAEDVKFFYDAMMNPFVQEPGAVSLRTYYSAIESVEMIDKFTLVVRWKGEKVSDGKGKETEKIKYMSKQLTGGLRPLASFVYKYFPDGRKIIEDDANPDSYRTNSVWAQNFAGHWAKNIIVSCGPWVFDGMSDRLISFKRNGGFYTPWSALTAGIDNALKDSPDNIWQAFKGNYLDSYALQPSQMSEYEQFLQSDTYKKQAARGAAIHRLDFVARNYTYIGWNEARPYFQSAKVRKALTMAIDRRRIIQDNLNGLGIEITGTFYRYSPSYDASISPLPYNPQMAKRMLEEEGWYDSDGDGTIDRKINGKRVPFRFSLTYYVKNPTIKSICEYVATALKEIGIDVRLNGVDIADISAAFDDKDFDALCLGWALGTPPEDPRQLWHSSGAKEKGSSNAIGFSNPDADKIIDALDYEYDPEKRTRLYHQFDAILHREQPYTFLFTPKTVFLYREYLKNVFIPAERQDLVPGADIAEPDSGIFWLKRV